MLIACYAPDSLGMSTINKLPWIISEFRKSMAGDWEIQRDSVPLSYFFRWIVSYLCWFIYICVSPYFYITFLSLLSSPFPSSPSSLLFYFYCVISSPLPRLSTLFSLFFQRHSLSLRSLQSRLLFLPLSASFLKSSRYYLLIHLLSTPSATFPSIFPPVFHSHVHFSTHSPVSTSSATVFPFLFPPHSPLLPPLFFSHFHFPHPLLPPPLDGDKERDDNVTLKVGSGWGVKDMKP